MRNLVLASVVTKNHLKEFLFLKASAEKYHSCKWYIYCDAYCSNYLGSFENVQRFEANISDGKVFGTEGEKKNFYDTIMTKFDACENALDENEYVLFVDSDIVFTNQVCPLFNEFVISDLDVVVSPHYQLDPKIDEDWGVFNVGFILIKSKELLKKWKEVTLSKEYLFEQKPLEVAISEGKFKVDTFPITYNMGWWRFNNDKTKHRMECMDYQRGKLSFSGLPIVSFHTHIFNMNDHPQCTLLSTFLMNTFNSLPNYKWLIDKYKEIQEIEI